MNESLRLMCIMAHPDDESLGTGGILAKYAAEGGQSVFIAYTSKGLRLTFEYGPEPGMISLRNCGFHDTCEAKI